MAVPTQKQFSALIKYKTEVHDGYVRIIVTGRYDFEEMMDLVQPFRDATVDAGRSRLLVDCTRMEGNVPEPDKFFIGEKIAKVFRADLKSALLMPRENITKLGEMVAVNRGASFRVTDSEPDAIDWLHETDPEK
jgi:hypothetical protein